MLLKNDDTYSSSPSQDCLQLQRSFNDDQINGAIRQNDILQQELDEIVVKLQNQNSHTETETLEWQKSCMNVCKVLTAHVEELAEFLNSLLNNSAGGIRGQHHISFEQRGLMRDAVDRSLNISRDILSLSVFDQTSLDQSMAYFNSLNDILENSQSESISKILGLNESNRCSLNQSQFVKNSSLNPTSNAVQSADMHQSAEVEMEKESERRHELIGVVNDLNEKLKNVKLLHEDTLKELDEKVKIIEYLEKDRKMIEVKLQETESKYHQMKGEFDSATLQHEKNVVMALESQLEEMQMVQREIEAKHDFEMEKTAKNTKKMVLENFTPLPVYEKVENELAIAKRDLTESNELKVAREVELMKLQDELQVITNEKTLLHEKVIQLEKESFVVQNLNKNEPIVEVTSVPADHDCLKIEMDFSKLKIKLAKTQKALHETWSKLKAANQRKVEIETNIRQQVQATHGVLKSVRNIMSGAVVAQEGMSPSEENKENEK